MAEDQDQKTEHPTGKRLDEARSQGRLPISREVGMWVSFLGILVVVSWLGPPMMGRLIRMLRVFLEAPESFVLDDRGLQTITLNVVLKAAVAAGLVFIVMAAAAIAGIMTQTGLFASLELIKPDVGRLSLVGGFKRLFSMNALVELGKSIGKLIVLGIAAFYTLKPVMDDLPAFTGLPLMGTMKFLHGQTIHLIVILLLVFTGIAIGDLYYQRFQYIKNLRMTKTEVKDEFRQQEGDPVIKGRLRQIRMEKARKRMMAAVPKADVVVTNPTHYAIALSYDNQKNAAPVVVAKGVDRIAERIRALAEEHKIPLVSNPPLARALYDTVDLDREIPAQHYRAVAEIISYVYKLRKKRT